MLASRYKPHDPLAAEFIRTFRDRNFPGKHYLDRYDAMVGVSNQMDVNLLLPRAEANKKVVDIDALYGFRSDHPDLLI